MSKKKLYISFILDETGSMLSAKSQTISGFNEYVESLKANVDDKVYFTLTKFNSARTQIVVTDASLNDVPPLTDSNYRPAETTPLYDAIGKTITSLESSVKKGSRCLVVIQTDGQENASREYDRRAIFDMIEEKKKAGWTFVFLGADQDAYLASQQIGISRGNTMSYDSHATRDAFHGVAMASVSYSLTGEQSTEKFFSKSDQDD